MKKTMYTLLIISALISCKKDDPSPTPNPTPTVPALPTEFQALANIFDGEGVGAAVNLTEDVLLIFNKDGDKYAWFEDQEIKVIHEVTDNDGPFQDCPFNDIGAIAYWTDARIYFFDKDGENYSRFDYSANEVEGSWNDDDLFSFDGETSETDNWGPDGTIPFSKVGAMWAWSFPGEDCFDAYASANRIWFSNEDGDEIVYYGSGNFQNEEDIQEWTAENNCGGPDGFIPFENIGAVCRYVKPNMIQEIFFNEEGTQFCYYTVSEGVFSEIYDLY